MTAETVRGFRVGQSVLYYPVGSSATPAEVIGFGFKGKRVKISYAPVSLNPSNKRSVYVSPYALSPAGDSL